MNILLKSKLLALTDQFAPRLRKRGRTIPSWMTWTLRKEIKARNRGWYQFSDFPTFQKHRKYRELRNNFTNNIHRAKAKFEVKLANKIKVDTRQLIILCLIMSSQKLK